MKGQTLIEVIVALAVGIMILTAVTSAVLTSVNNVSRSTLQTGAEHYSQQGLEVIRGIRDNDLSAFGSLTGLYCMASSCESLSQSIGDECGLKLTSCGQNVDVYSREVIIEKNAPSCRLTPAPTDVATNGTQVTVNVLWSDKQCTEEGELCNRSTVSSCLFNTNL